MLQREQLEYEGMNDVECQVTSNGTTRSDGHTKPSACRPLPPISWKRYDPLKGLPLLQTQRFATSDADRKTL
jgi:hypothetical protein